MHVSSAPHSMCPSSPPPALPLMVQEVNIEVWVRDSALNGVRMDSASHQQGQEGEHWDHKRLGKGQGLPLVTLSAWLSLMLGIPLPYPLCTPPDLVAIFQHPHGS